MGGGLREKTFCLWGAGGGVGALKIRIYKMSLASGGLYPPDPCIYRNTDLHLLPSTRDRDWSIQKKKVINQRLCKVCNEFHFLMTCKAYQTERNFSQN